MEKVIFLLANAIATVLEGLQKLVSRTPNFLITFILLSLLYLSFVPNGNEEQYMQLAKQYMNPDWIYNSKNLTESGGTRIIYQIFFGSLLKLSSFETVVFSFRLILILSFSIVTSKIYKELKIGNFQIVLHLILFLIVFNQSFFGGSFMLISVEPKCFSYLAVLMSFYSVLKNRFFLVIAFLILATYIHILVGAYSAIYLGLTLFLFPANLQSNRNKVFAGFTIYAILILPFVYYLKTNSLTIDSTANSVSASWIYTYYRAPHHTALFKTALYFFKTHLNGILQALCALVFVIMSYKHASNRGIKLLTQFAIISLFGTLLLVSVAFIDETGEILKFYLYRINTLSTFFVTIIISYWIYEAIKKSYLNMFNKFFIIVIVPIYFLPAAYNFREASIYGNPQLVDICYYIKENTEKKDILFSFEEDLSVTRRTERNRFVVNKFIPAQLNLIHNWYFRMLDKEAMLESSENLITGITKNKIDYILAKATQAIPNQYILQYSNSEYALYKVDR